MAAAGMCLLGGSVGTASVARAEDMNYVCTGVHVAHRSSDPVASKESVTLKAQNKSFLIGLPDAKDPVQAQTVADNGTALILRAAGMTIQYMRLTGNLFLIHDDGRLTRLACAVNK